MYFSNVVVVFKNVSTMEVKNSLSDSQSLGSINRNFGRPLVSVKRDNGFVLERCPLLANLQFAAVSD